ncbi:MAG TPA: LutB/LldF family L-lactate oxidation iron-sulfur protein [Terriglobales bacterium]|nr:LutB/LldF family L-lactate oxidation iron-sulfur protein [Terriglobales bacterium]
MSAAAREFLRRAAEKSGDLAHRQVVRFNMDQYEAAVARGHSRFTDWEAARERCRQIKWEAVNHLDRYLLEFETKVQERGGHVFWAETSEEARRYVCDLAVARGVKKVVKSKSMVTEEVHLTPALEKLGMEVFETDLGEYIVQLRNEPPYHIVTPAMHLNRGQIRDLFKEKLGGGATDDPPELVAVARRTLRQAFFSAEMGISGANFLVADAGMVAITTNEGNGRLCTSIPRIHVVMTGIEKVVPRLQDLAMLWPVLATSGTGQPITCYNTLLAGARRAGEVDGPEEFHVVLVDNGRSQLLADSEQRDVLHCIRCGACLNACPVYRAVGGHTYGTIYQGPIGSVLTPHLRGLSEFQHLSYASSLCGNCTDVCPVKIDLHHHLLHNRRNAIRAGTHPGPERRAMRLFRWTMMDAGRFRILGGVARASIRLAHALGLGGTALDPMRAWTRRRAPMVLPSTSFRSLWRKTDGFR